MPRLRRSTAPRVHALLRSLAVLISCLGVAAVSLASAGAKPGNPGAAVVASARAHLGDTYTWGATGPHSWDCSGFTSTLWREVGGVKDIPRTSRQQQAWAVPLPREQVEPGDLVFFGDPVDHVGIVENVTTTKTGTTVAMLDASSSQKGVVARAVWTKGVIRYGRVPRKGMTPVTAWAPQAPSPVVTATPSPVVGKPVTVKASAAPAVKSRPPLQGLPSSQQSPSSPVALKAVRLARATLGNTSLTDVELIANVWRRAGGAVLPSTRSGLSAAGRRVPTVDARIGDLIVYAAPASHVGIYVGGGLMVDASRSLGKVVLRQVWAAEGVQIMRLAR